jgi:hypothetical protein
VTRVDVWTQYIQQNPATPTRSIDGEALVITPQDSTLHALNETATFVWDRADGKQRVCDIATALLNDFDVDEATARAEVTRFVEEAVARGLLHASAQPLG